MDISTINQNWGYPADPVSESGFCRYLVQDKPFPDCVEHSVEGLQLGTMGVYPIEGMVVSTAGLVFNNKTIEKLLSAYRRPETQDRYVAPELVAWVNGRRDILQFIDECEALFSSCLGRSVLVKPDLYQDFDDDGNLAVQGLLLSVDYGIEFDPEAILALEEKLLTEEVFSAADQLNELIVISSVYG